MEECCIVILGDYKEIAYVVMYHIRSDGIALLHKSVLRTILCYRRYGSDVVRPSLLRKRLLTIYSASLMLPYPSNAPAGLVSEHWLVIPARILVQQPRWFGSCLLVFRRLCVFSPEVNSLHYERMVTHLLCKPVHQQARNRFARNVNLSLG